MANRQETRSHFCPGLAAALVFVFAQMPRLATAQGDFDNALTLARNGQFDRAEQVAAKLAKSPELKASADLIRAEILLARSDAEGQIEPAVQWLDESIDLLRTCLRGSPRKTSIAMTQRGIDWRMHRKAARMRDALLSLKPSEPPRRREELLQKSIGMFETAALRLRDRIRELKSSTTSSDDLDIAELAVDLGRTLLEHARLPNLPGDSKRSVIQEAITLLQDVQLDYADDAISFEAMWLEGLFHAEVGAVGLARDRFEGAVTLLRRVRAAKKEPTEYQLGVAQNAYVDLCRSFLEDKNPAEVKRIVETAFREEAALERGLPGLALKLQKADALFLEGDIEGGFSIASQVMSADPGGKIGAVAREKVRAWAAEGTSQGGKLSPERLLVLATALLESEDWSQALQTLQSTLELAQASDEGKKVLPEALFKIGQCLYRLGKYKDSAESFQRLLKEHGEDTLAPRACFEAVRALSSEYAATGSKEVETAKEALLSLLLTKWPGHPVSRNVVYLKAEMLERDKKYSEAATLYSEVPEDAEAIESALLAGARCRYLQGCLLWDSREKEKQSEARESAKKEMIGGLATLETLFDRFPNPSLAPQGASATRQRASLIFLATGQKALLQSHDAIGEHASAIEGLSSYAQGLGKEDPRLARILALEVRPHLALGQSDDAIRIVDLLFEKFPENQAALPAFRSAAAYLDQTAADLKGKGTDPAQVKEQLAKSHKLYLHWARVSEKRGVKLNATEVLSVAEALASNAKTLNGLPENASFLLSPGATLESPQFLADALSLFRSVLDGKLGPVDSRERLPASISAARLEGLLSNDAGGGWEKARRSYDAIAREAKLFSEGVRIDPKALATPQQSLLLRAYMELGVACQQESKQGQNALFDMALEIFQSVQSVTPGESEPWWTAKLLAIRALAERATPSDIRNARIILEGTEENYPELDKDAFGIKSKLLELKGRLASAN